MEKSVQDRWGDFRFVIVSAVFAVSYIAARGLLELEMAVPLRVVVALLPVPLFALWLITIIRGIRALDELERRIQLEALAVAFPLSLVLVLTLGLLELAVGLSRNDWSYRHIWPMLIAFYFLGLAIARRRYQ